MAEKHAPTGLERMAQPEKPQSVDWASHFSREALARTLPTLRVIISQFQGMPGVIGLHGGLPAPSAFPITSLSFTLRDGTTATIDDPAKLDAMQQYSVAPLGYAPLQQWTEQHTRAMHSPPAGTSYKTSITNGSNSSLEMVMSLLLNEGDSVLVERFTYSHVVENVINFRGLKAVPLDTDIDGILPGMLRRTLQAAKEAAMVDGSRPPRVLYTVPTGQNPTGLTCPIERKAELYAVCSEFDVIILEDDPYWYLQFGRTGEVPGLGSRLERSFLSLDMEGRVIRLDSFAKFLAPGLRLGWITAAPLLVEKFTFCLHGTTLGACATTQVLVSEMIQAWGPAGLEAHTCTMQRSYAHRAQVVLAAAEKHLTGLAEWTTPSAGMFMWMKLLAGITDADEILDELKENKVVVVPGRIFHALGPVPPESCPFVRISFSSASDEDLTEGIARLATVMRRYQASNAAKP